MVCPVRRLDTGMGGHHQQVGEKNYILEMDQTETHKEIFIGLALSADSNPDSNVNPSGYDPTSLGDPNRQVTVLWAIHIKHV